MPDLDPETPQAPPPSHPSPPPKMFRATPDLAPYAVELADREGPIDWRGLFGDDHPVELEVGPGKGLYLANAGAARPEHNFLGIEMARKYALMAAERIAKKKLTNVRVTRDDAAAFLKRKVAPGSLAAVHVYYPDPWWKKRHRKRRIFTDEFVADIARALGPGGELHIATDVEEYFGVMMEVMAAQTRLAPIPTPELPQAEHEQDYLTNFERKYRKEGRASHRASYRLVDEA